jgi:4-amino-4-deoxy-L-arabinose transferase-like glycosyltransferase
LITTTKERFTKTGWIILTTLLVLSYFPLLHNLGRFQIRMWDEATYANNAIDMYSGGNLVVVDHMGKPDDYNTKPPFVIWCQALSMHLIGVNELAVRLPSAVFGLATVLLVFLFCSYTLGSTSTGFIASLILLTAPGYIANHVARTGDLDATLVFWLTLGLFTFIDMVFPPPPRTHIIRPKLPAPVILS